MAEEGGKRLREGKGGCNARNIPRRRCQRHRSPRVDRYRVMQANFHPPLGRGREPVSRRRFENGPVQKKTSVPTRATAFSNLVVRFSSPLPGCCRTRAEQQTTSSGRGRARDPPARYGRAVVGGECPGSLDEPSGPPLKDGAFGPPPGCGETRIGSQARGPGRVKNCEKRKLG